MLPVWILLGCASPLSGVAADMARYDAVLSDPLAAPDAAFQACAALVDPKLQGDCAMVVALRFAAGPDASVSRWCSRVPEGTWRSECLFEGAELDLRRGQPDRAVLLCLQAGPFRDDCAMHLWQVDLDGVTGNMGTADFAARLPSARALYSRWLRPLGSDTDFEARFWRRYYEAGFGARASVDLRVCDALEPADAARCQQAGAEVFARQLGPFLHATGALDWFCGPSAPGSAALAPRLGAQPHPALDAVIAARRPQLCETETGG